MADTAPAAAEVLPWSKIQYDAHGNRTAAKRLKALAATLGDIEFDGAAPAEGPPQSFREAKARAVEAFERGYLEQLLLENAGNISRAARAAQKNRRAFFELLRRHEIDVTRYRNTLI